jgi:hypothetical protein
VRRLLRLAERPLAEAAYLPGRYRAWATRVLEEERARGERWLADSRRVHREAFALVGETAARALDDGAARLEEMLDVALDDYVIRLAFTGDGPAPIRILANADELSVWSERKDWWHEITVSDDGAWRNELRARVTAVLEGRAVGDEA